MPDLLHPQGDPDEEVEESPFDPGDFALAMSAENQLEAELLVGACEDAGIPAILQSPRSGPVGTIASPVDGFQILVPAREMDRAVRILNERRTALDEDPEGAARAAEAEEAETETR